MLFCRRPPRLKNFRIILAYKNFAAHKGVSHIGLGVSAMNTAKTLTSLGAKCEVWPILDANDLRKKLNLDSAEPTSASVTQVVISAPWIPTLNLFSLCTLFPEIQFAVNCHSNVGFLQADPNGMRLVREGLELEMSVPNFSLAANSEKMVRWIENAYGRPCTYLPNLYFLEKINPPHRPRWKHGTLRIGIFGATRPQKNLASAVAAAIEIGYELKTSTEIWISGGRAEGGGNTVLNTIRAMTQGLPSVSLHESPWMPWPKFRRLVGSMHLLLQPSYTESFNMVTADGIAEGVPCVVSEAIAWAPENWKANVDEVFEIARVGRGLLRDRKAPKKGYRALQSYLFQGVEAWEKFLRQ